MALLYGELARQVTTLHRLVIFAVVTALGMRYTFFWNYPFSVTPTLPDEYVFGNEQQVYCLGYHLEVFAVTSIVKS